VQRAPEIRAYPWASLETVPREALQLMVSARRAVRRAIDERKIAEVLSEFLGDHVSVRVSDVRVVVDEVPALRGAVVSLRTADDAVRVELDVERELARVLVGRIIGKPARLGDPRAAVAPEVEGALVALVCSVARRAHGSSEALLPIGSGALRFAPGERRLGVEVTILIGPEAYAARATIHVRRPFESREANPSADLASLGALPISLPVVVATSLADAPEVLTLSAGDVWLPGSGWSVHHGPSARGGALLGSVILTAPGADRGIRATIGEAGEIVVVGVETLQHDAEAISMGANQDDRPATPEAILEAPVVVRVELGSVTMTAREWSLLGAGDVIAVGRRVSEPVILRIAGMEVARGELVDIEGELGVRIREQVKAE
jgi:flagellar motor switch/type III secretory pathway protein FliN